MQQFAGEENDLVLLRNDRLVASLAHVYSAVQARVVNPQFTAFELSRLAMEKVNKSQVPRGNRLAAVVAVKVEEVSVIAGRDLGLYPGDGEFFHPQLVQHLRQRRRDAFQHDVLMTMQLHQNP